MAGAAVRPLLDLADYLREEREGQIHVRSICPSGKGSNVRAAQKKQPTQSQDSTTERWPRTIVHLREHLKINHEQPAH
jgi:hypothetical protein